MSRVVIIIILFYKGIGLEAQRTDFSGRPSTSQSPATFQTPTDTTKRPPFIFELRDIYRLDSARTNNDTLLKDVYLFEVEKIRRDQIRSIGGLGSSEESFSLSSSSQLGIQSGNRLHQPILSPDRLASVVEVNRSFFRIDYRKSLNINANDLQVDFARRFASNILLNFNYVQMDDDNFVPQNEMSGSRMDIKFAQYNPHKTRFTTLWYQSGKLNEAISPFGSQSNLTGNTLARNSNIGLYNTIVLDSSATKRLHSNLSYTSYGVDFKSKADFGNTFLGSIFFIADTLSHINNESKFSFSNEYSIRKDSVSYSFGIELNLFQLQFVNSTEALIESIIKAEYVRKLMKSQLQVYSGFGLSERGISGRLSFKYLQDRNRVWHLSQSLYLNRSVPLTNQLALYYNQELIINEFRFPTSVSSETVVTNDSKNITLSIEAFVENNPILWRGENGFQQFGNALTWLKATIDYRHEFWFMDIEHRLLFQHEVSNLLAAPPMVFQLSVLTDFKVFKDRMSVVLGADGIYYYDHLVPMFNPVVSAFFRETNAVTRSGHVVEVRPYLNFKVDSFQAFIRLDNSLSRLYSDQRFLVQSFPIQDFRIRFGLKWTLLD